MGVVILIIIIIIAVCCFKTNKIENQQDAKSKSKVKYTNECKITVVDNDKVMVKVLSISEDNESMTLHVQAQSKGYHSDDVHFYFSVDSIDSLKTHISKFYDVHNTNVNYWHMEVPKKTGGIFGISPDLLNMTKIDFNVHVYTGEPEYSYQNTIFEKTFSIYPYGKDKVIKFVRDVDESEIAVVDNEKAYVSIVSIQEDRRYHSVHISGFLINKTDKEMSLYLEDGEINGMAINFESTMYDLWHLPAGYSGYFSYYLSQELSDLGLESINDIKTLKLVLPKEITTRNKIIDINKNILKFD